MSRGSIWSGQCVLTLSVNTPYSSSSSIAIIINHFYSSSSYIQSCISSSSVPFYTTELQCCSGFSGSPPACQGSYVNDSN